MSTQVDRVLKRRAALKVKGLCRSCGQVPARQDRQTCAKCAAQGVKSQKKLLARLAAQGICTTCRKAPARPRRHNCAECNRQILSQRALKYRADRSDALDYYGGKCRCCGEDNVVFLQFDHIYGGGGQHRKLDLIASNNMGMWLRRHGYPDWIQLLCANCNYARSTNGICPHDVNALMDDANSAGTGTPPDPPAALGDSQ